MLIIIALTISICVLLSFTGAFAGAVSDPPQPNLIFEASFTL